MNRYLVVILIAVIAIFLSRGQRFYIPSESAVTPARLAKVLENTNDKVLLFFWQPKDAASENMDPLVTQWMSEYPALTLIKIDTSNAENRPVHDNYNINTTPTFITIKKGKIISQWIGPFKDKAQFIVFLRPSSAY